MNTTFGGNKKTEHMLSSLLDGKEGYEDHNELPQAENKYDFV